MQVVKFTARYIQIKLVFTNPLYISLDQFYPDHIMVTVIDPSTFISAIDFSTTALKNSSS